MSLHHINDRLVPISRFNKGEANKIFDEVARDGFRIVMKNNEAKCILLSPESYDAMLDMIEDYRDLQLAKERAEMQGGKPVSMREAAERMKITAEDVEAAPDVEFA